MARPTSYTKKIGDRICEEIAGGSNLLKLLVSDEFPSRQTVYNWLDEHPEFFDNYARARVKRADFRADRIEDITDKLAKKEITPDVARVMIDAEKWLAGKENSRRYGDKTTLAGDPDNPVVTKAVDPHGIETLKHFAKLYAKELPTTPSDNGEDLA